MEILQSSLKNEDLEAFTAFQGRVWNILEPLLKKLKFDKLSEDSVVEMGGIGIDVFLRMNTSYFVLIYPFKKITWS